MATYWDYRSQANSCTTTGTVTGQMYNVGACTGTAYAGQMYNTLSTGTYWVCRTIFVEVPESWSDDILARYVKLINDDTTTGWRVLAVIDGKIRITDPNVEVRSMEAFRLLLKDRASDADREKIDKFFASVGG